MHCLISIVLPAVCSSREDGCSILYRERIGQYLAPRERIGQIIQTMVANVVLPKNTNPNMNDGKTSPLRKEYELDLSGQIMLNRASSQNTSATLLRDVQLEEKHHFNKSQNGLRIVIGDL